MKFYRKLLFPFVPVYYAVTWVRNKCYDLGIKKSVSFDFPVICVGNLSVGGTGKTPMIEYLIELLKDDHKIATLSRGYKRKSDGFQLANNKSSAESLGDEPYQFYSKYKSGIQVAVDNNRVHGINSLKSIENTPEVILLDDAFQHRKVKAGFNLLLTTYDNLYVNDFLLPAGNLRESRNGAKRADFIIVTKCPLELNKDQKENLIRKINPLNQQHVFFSRINYADVIKSSKESRKLDDISGFTLVTGIANAGPLVEYLRNRNLKFEHLNFHDHYNFTLKDVEQLSKNDLIITTEKDFMRLQNFESLKGRLFYLPIHVTIDNSETFNDLIKKFIHSKK
ncbi:tetraacyldisaccharide 4'-kinase [Gaetbulibacter aquiaggeris]|uniref:Tetraacyldisaccharide 4'-kinase n=1 Tax=Gaetbulibacter aquiaggeris TaxID=1735373 RepID=A0ABW7MMI5_9FLAO